ncbi:MAG: hypothetical protein M9921_12555 [Fimbriimonadaceae bacterium]|nr:hypothetical protein [Chthonomonadaceae bacterium]MCO5297679.1 hypothetical protein [Fimbriimonadaceae bacterium]
MKILHLLAWTVLAALLVGCSKNPIVGTWEGSDPTMPTTAAATFQFDGDGTYTTSVTIQGMSLAVKGKYTLVEKTLTMTPETLEASGNALAEMAKDAFAKSEKKPMTSTVEFKDNDQMTLTVNGATTTLKRKS